MGIFYAGLGIVAAVLLAAYICFRMTFYSNRKKQTIEQYPLPVGKCYEPYYDAMRKWMAEVDQMPCRQFEITSFDGLKLRGRYYENAPGGPIEVMFPGYRGIAKRDLCGGVQRCAELGHNALIVDQRGNGESEGTVITFGVKEYRDCLSWVEFAAKEFPHNKLILCGISMGASTVMIASGEKLPDSVIGTLADCGFTSAKEIIGKVIRDMKLPPKLVYPFIRLGAKLFGGFDPEEKSAVDAVKNARVPIVFIHGEDDDFVPCEMSRINYEACASQKHLAIIPGAAHGTSYVVQPEQYLQILREFWKDRK